jgi:putative ABC transport system permease protein
MHFRPFTDSQTTRMLKNYFKVILRNLTRNKVHSFINIAGLSVGMTVAIVIGLWIWDELTFDKYHGNYNRITQVKQHLINNGEKGTWSTLPYPLAGELRNKYGGNFKYVVMSANWGEHVLTAGDKMLMKTGNFFEPDAPDMLTLKMLKGTRQALRDPSSVILSSSVAKAYFNDEDPMGKRMKIDSRMEVTVAGVYEDMPHNTTFGELGFIAPWALYFNNFEWIRTASDPWRPNAFTIFAQLTDNADIDKVSFTIKDAKLKNVNAQLAKKKPELFLQAMSQWHLYSEYKNGVNVGGRIKYVWLFGIIGAFVLLLACINFMNLSTARSEKRAKEVGIRKAVGSLRSQLIYQFFVESLTVVFLSFLISLILAILILPFFNNVADKQMTIPWNNPSFWMMGIGFSLFTGLVAGSYPAFYLSSFEPVKILKGTFRTGRWAAIPRKVLVVAQFSVSVTMIIGTLVVFRQIQYTKDRPIGYDLNGLVYVQVNTSDIHNHFDAVKEELIQSGTILSMAEPGSPPTESWSTSSGFEWKGKDPGMSVDFHNMFVSYDYGKLIGWKIKEGRDFSKDFASDSSGFIINEAAAKFMNLKHPVGETIRWNGQPFTVIGVVEDMVVNSPYDEARPMMFYVSNDWGFPVAKINPSVSASKAVADIERVFKKFNPSQPFVYRFVDEEYQKKFGNEVRIGKLAGFFAALAIFISCLGIFGLASFMAEQRTKEIGVRKVLGASVFNLWQLLSKDFVLLVCVSLLISVPLAYYFMHNWLQNYTYHTNLAWWIFAAAAFGAIAITLLTVSFQGIKAALANPVKSLRTE